MWIIHSVIFHICGPMIHSCPLSSEKQKVNFLVRIERTFTCETIPPIQRESLDSCEAIKARIRKCVYDKNSEKRTNCDLCENFIQLHAKYSTRTFLENGSIRHIRPRRRVSIGKISEYFHETKTIYILNMR